MSQPPTAPEQNHPDLPRNSADPVGPPGALQAPWRLDYLLALEASEKRAGASPKPSGSFLRDYWLAPHADLQNHVIVRSPHGMVLLNGFPYTNGHVLIALGEGRGRLLDYDPIDRRRLWTLTDLATDLVERTLECQGVNIGINQGRAAGAGVPGHLHVHVVPRWGGDVNFMSVVGRIRVIPSSLSAMAERLRATWQERSQAWQALIAD